MYGSYLGTKNGAPNSCQMKGDDIVKSVVTSPHLNLYINDVAWPVSEWWEKQEESGASLFSFAAPASIRWVVHTAL